LDSGRVKKINRGIKMKNIKLISLLLVVVLSVSALGSCSLVEKILGGGSTGGSGTNQYVLEAEYIDLSDIQGAGESSSQGGVQMIFGSGESDKSKGWSNGYYVAYTYVADLKLDFVFQSDADATASIVLRLGSELGTLLLTPDLFEVQLNGEIVPYATLSLPGGSSLEDMKFYDLTVNTNAKVKAGENTLSLIVRDNKLVAGERVGAPCIDCVKITTSANLTWTPKLDNPDNRGNTDLD
jgi:hypothetical protein